MKIVLLLCFTPVLLFGQDINMNFTPDSQYFPSQNESLVCRFVTMSRSGLDLSIDMMVEEKNGKTMRPHKMAVIKLPFTVRFDLRSLNKKIENKFAPNKLLYVSVKLGKIDIYRQPKSGESLVDFLRREFNE